MLCWIILFDIVIKVTTFDLFLFKGRFVEYDEQDKTKPEGPYL